MYPMTAKAPPGKVRTSGSERATSVRASCAAPLLHQRSRSGIETDDSGFFA